MGNKRENVKLHLDEAIKSSFGRISELLAESSGPDEDRQAVVSTVAQVEATLAVARSIEYLAETLQDFAEAQTGQ